MRLKESGSLERIRTEVKGLVQGMTANFMITLDQLAEMDSKSLEHIREKFKEIVMLLTENLDSLFFDLIAWHWSWYVCESDALYECMRCNRDVCDTHAIFAETEYEEPLTYCHECFREAVGE
jgi:DNA-directed RNA polymerase subunit RPC12/RpoP